MFIISSISSGLELWSVMNTSLQENFDLKVFENITFYSETSSKWPNDLQGTNIHKTLESC